MRSRGVLLAVVIVLACSVPSVAAAYDEIHYPSSTYDHAQRTPALPGGYEPHYDDTRACVTCHGKLTSDTCESCHPPSDFNWTYTYQYFEGPHGYYTNATDYCDMCHVSHDSPGVKLLMAPTMTASCYTCHDGTGGQGVYGSIQARLGTPAPGGHSIDTTSVVPGGSWATGGSATFSFKGVSGTLTCADCHTPHGRNTVTAFVGERADRPFWMDYGQDMRGTRMLRQRPANVATAVTEYGSDWCLTCHAGRSSGGPTHNHPVESKQVRANPYNYRNLPIVAAALGSSTPSHDQWVSEMVQIWTYPNLSVPSLSNPNVNVLRDISYVVGGSGYVMPYPRTAVQAGRGPICQQCHEDARDPGYLDATGAAVITWTRIFGVDGSDPLDNPRFQNFPHETENANMTLEVGDDLCMNCHPANMLP